MARFEKVVVAIHGVGDQCRSETVRAVAAQFGARVQPPPAVQPLGYFSVDGSAQVKVSGLDFGGRTDPECRRLEQVGFAEVYWADIPREVVRGGYTLEETKAWGRTIVSRAEALYRRDPGNLRLTPRDFQQAAGVVEEIVESVEVIGNLSFVAGKMGLFKFDLAPLLRDYVDDVQVVTEFPLLRDRIVARFHRTMAGILRQFTHEGWPAPELYIVAHSEGTVVSFLALLQALARLELPDPETPDARLPVDWITQVRGYMTIGSPIDKHIVLWERIFDQFAGRLKCEGLPGGAVEFQNPSLVLPQRIDWRNYYDYGDPIGFQLDTARSFLQESGCKAFDFGDDHDIGFARYPCPGKAHVDYWKDTAVFRHFIEHVVLEPAGRPAPAPTSKTIARVTSYAMPYAIALTLHLLAVFLLFKGLDAWLDAEDIPMLALAQRVGALGALLFAVTVAARIPRLVKLDPHRRADWLLAGMSAALVGVTAWMTHLIDPSDVTLGLLASAVAVALSGYALPLAPRWGRTVLLLLGLVVVTAFATVHVLPYAVPDEWGPFWTMVLAGAGFLYLWWLGLMMFDLSFVWHRYIRHALAHDSLHSWRQHALRPRSATGSSASAAVA